MEVRRSAALRLARDRYEAGDHDGDWGDVGGERRECLVDAARLELEALMVGEASRTERDDAHDLAEQSMTSALGWETSDRQDIRDDLRELGDAVRWLAAETRAARLDRGCEVG
jgi:hypothetical protein